MVRPPLPFSALYRPPRMPVRHQSAHTPLRNWTVEPDPQYPRANPSANFSTSSGEYVIPVDGLYLVVAQLIPINGAFIASAARNRLHVDYTLRFATPPPPPSLLEQAPDPDPMHHLDVPHNSFFDLGPSNFGKVFHLRKGTAIACLHMSASPPQECIRLKVEIIQRKRKPIRPELTRKQIKKRRTIGKRRHGSSNSTTTPSSSLSPPPPYSPPPTSEDDSSGSDSDQSDWESGFESDATTDHFPHSSRGVRRLAKRFKTSTSTTHLED